MKQDAHEFAEENVVKDLIKKYSEFINFPIYLKTLKEVSKEVPIDEVVVDDASEEDSEEEDDKKDDKKDEVEVTDDDDRKKKVPKTQTIKEIVP